MQRDKFLDKRHNKTVNLTHKMALCLGLYSDKVVLLNVNDTTVIIVYHVGNMGVAVSLQEKRRNHQSKDMLLDTWTF